MEQTKNSVAMKEQIKIEWLIRDKRQSLVTSNEIYPFYYLKIQIKDLKFENGVEGLNPPQIHNPHCIDTDRKIYNF